MRDGRVVKGVRFRNHRDVGDIVELAARYSQAGADELVFYDITASPEGRGVDRQWIDRIAAELTIPFCVAGGIRSIADAEAVLNRGADKISVNSPALARPGLVDELARRFGTQCVVVGVDSMRGADGSLKAFRNTGDPDKSDSSGRDVLAWVAEVASRGAGEIVLNSINQDGVRNGYDIGQLQAVRAAAPIPLIASGGAGVARHFRDVFVEADVSGALAASVFHSGEIAIADLKRYLASEGVRVRPADGDEHV